MSRIPVTFNEAVCPECAGYLTHIAVIGGKGYVVPKAAFAEIERLRGLMQGWHGYGWREPGHVYIDSLQEFFNEHLGTT